jgi:hypothetical protein
MGINAIVELELSHFLDSHFLDKLTKIVQTLESWAQTCNASLSSVTYFRAVCEGIYREGK